MQDKLGGQVSRPKVLIVGGGFGGLSAARALRRVAVDSTLVDRRNYHLFQPLLYQVATGELSPANIAAPLRAILRRQQNCRVLLGEVVDFDLEGRRVLLSSGELPYDYLIVAAGAGHSYFGHDDWRPLAPGLKTIEDATEIRRRILFAFEAAERESDAAARQAWLTFIIVGGGPTGVELAGALSEIAHQAMRRDFRSIDSASARIVIVEAGPRILGMYPDELIKKAGDSLQRLDVEVRAGAKVVGLTENRVIVACGDATDEIATRTVIWAAGVKASPLGKKLAERSGAELDRGGRVSVGADLTLPGRPEVFVIGDVALCRDEEGSPLPGVAPVAMQQGEYAAHAIASKLRGEELKPFRYHDHGKMAVIGRFAAVAVLGRWKLSGFVAWVIWLFLHVMEITQFRNRLLVLVQWGWTFVTRDRSARLITNVAYDADETTENLPSESAT